MLSKHGYLRSGRTNAAFNFYWWQSAEPAVDRLNAKLRLHIDKVEFYTKPSEFEAVIRNGSEIQQLRRQVANIEHFMIHGAERSQSLSANIVSDELKAKLDSQFQMKSPSWSAEGSELPLKEAFEALAVHFMASTVMFNPMLGLSTVPEVSQYLSLAKSIWILEKIKRSHNFQIVGPESIWTDRMRRCEDDLRGQLHRFEAGELEKPPIRELLELPMSSFSISDGDAQNSDPLDAGQAGPMEEKILELQLPSESDNRESALLVFRENETDFRLVVTTKQADSLVAQYDKEIELSMDRHRLIPAYANPFQGPSPRHNVLLLNERGKKPKEFNFLSHEDVTKLQRGLLGYRVHHQMPVARWCIDGSKMPYHSGSGILQLWQFKPLLPMMETNLSKSSDTDSSVRSPESPLSKLSSSKSPTALHIDSSKRGGQNGDSVDFVGWSGFPYTPRTDKIENCGPRISLYSDTQEAQVLQKTSSNAAKRESFGRLSQKELFARAPSIAAQSNTMSHRHYNRSSIASSAALTAQSSVVSQIRGPRGDGVEFLRPELPVLVITTFCNGRYSLLHLTRKYQITIKIFLTSSLIRRAVDPSIKIEPGLCGCRNPRQQCNRVVLKSKKRFTVRTLIADVEGDKGLESWDLSVFRLPWPDKLKNAKVNERVSFLELQFVDEEGKSQSNTAPLIHTKNGEQRRMSSSPNFCL